MDHLHVDLSVSALARRFSLEESVLLSAFQSHTGIALDQFVLRRRIERALHLLKHSNASDSEIAMGMDGVQQSAFQAAFSNYLGVSPREYRREFAAETAGCESRETEAPLQVCLLTAGRIPWTALPVLAV